MDGPFEEQSIVTVFSPSRTAGGPLGRVYEPRLRRIVIPSDAVARVATGLFRLGVTRAQLFPGPDSVAATVVWAVQGEVDRLADDVIAKRSNHRGQPPA